MFWGWKLWVRQNKVNRLKSAIIEHKRTQNFLRSCLKAWKQSIHSIREGLKILDLCSNTQLKKLLFAYLKHKVREFKAQKHQ